MAADTTAELVIGRITAADDLVGGRGPSYRLTLDLGPRGIRQASIYVSASYVDREALVGRQVVCALDASDAVVLFAQSHARGVILIQPDREVEDGTLVA
jgi:tRNA-binding protein